MRFFCQLEGIEGLESFLQRMLNSEEVWDDPPVTAPAACLGRTNLKQQRNTYEQ